MSKPIKMTEQFLDECRRDFEKALELTKLADGKLNFTKTFTCGEAKATVYFTAEAWAKMAMLIKEFDKEIAWHGVASRVDDDSKNEYVISDILVYPQEVTGASVEMDTEKYAIWIMENADDERFDNIRMQGHSHVNMSTTPSSVDLNHQEEILNMLGDSDFYIFMIWNKSFISNVKVYDMKKNILFENADVTVKLIGGTEDLDAFLKSAKEKVTTKQYNGGRSYTPPGTVTPPAGSYNPLPAKDEKKDAGKDGRREKTRSRIGAGWYGADEYGQRTLYDSGDEDYRGYPYSHGGYGLGYYGG